VVESRFASVLPVQGPDYYHHHFVGHADVVPGSPEDGEDLIHAINEGCDDIYSEVSIKII
jgi:hypothetical protein